MFSNQLRPGNRESLYRHCSSIFTESVMLSWERLSACFHFLRNQTPTSKNLLYEYKKPRCGELIVKKVVNLSRNYSRLGKAALAISPPKLKAIIESFVKFWPGQNSIMYCLISFANLSPISKMLCSDFDPSLQLLRRNRQFGLYFAIWFRSSFKSDPLPRNPWTITNKWVPLVEGLSELEITSVDDFTASKNVWSLSKTKHSSNIIGWKLSVSSVRLLMTFSFYSAC